MPHISEGDLHAYLDGALAAIEPAAEERLRAHLAACADCRARLERERGIHDRSTELLAAVLPEPVEIPPFEALRGSGARGGTGAPGGRSRLAWAASVAVALGAGWIGHALLGGSGESVPNAPLASEAPAGSREVRESVADDADATAGEAAVDETSAAADIRQRAEAELAPDEPATEPAAPQASRRNVTPAAEADADTKVAAKEGTEDARRDTVARTEAVEMESIPLRAAAPSDPGVDAFVPSVVDAAADVEARGKAFAGAAWRPATRDEAAEWMGRPLLAVPDLEVLEIKIAEIDGLRVARVRQALPDGAPLELVLERGATGRDRAAAGAEPRRLELQDRPVSDALAGEEGGAAIWRRVGIVAPPEGEAAIEGLRALIDGSWVTLAAPVASDSLRAIVSRVHRLETP